MKIRKGNIRLDIILIENESKGKKCKTRSDRVKSGLFERKIRSLG